MIAGKEGRQEGGRIGKGGKGAATSRVDMGGQAMEEGKLFDWEF